MSAPSDSSPPPRRWNLGKVHRSSPPTASPPKQTGAPKKGSGGDSSAAAERQPPHKPIRPLATPANEEVGQERDKNPPLGRRVEDPGGRRREGSVLTHPITRMLVGVGLLLSLGWLYLSGALTGPRIRTMPPPNPEERIQSFLALLTTQDLVESAPPDKLTAAGRGWVLVASGQLLESAGIFVEQGNGRPAEEFQSIPDALNAFRPSSGQSPNDLVRAMAWEERALGAIAVGQQVVARARQAGLHGRELHRLGSHLYARGLTELREGVKGDFREGSPGLKEAVPRLLNRESTGELGPKEVELIRQALPQDLARLVEIAVSLPE